ncbi:cytochrome P450 [Linderina pennispora]|uniref:NADPH--hemoprotein reductase n=1 Tax=Linderina pennispora TaxID=61395 RepID=A0A1Y1VXS5_9FUNG|nr:cytochrome P450 [Linderina pennispora]ORX66079.1 cytochrome P450 [Linderina pennispora]
MTTAEYPDAAVDSGAMVCPAMHGRAEEVTAFVVVVEQGKSVEEGVIVSFGSNSSMKQLRQSVAAKLKIADADGITLLSSQEGSEAAYVQTASVRRAIPYIKGYPVVGIVPMIIRDTRECLSAPFYVFSTHVVATRDPAYFYKKVQFPFSEVRQVGGTGLFTTGTPTAYAAFSVSAMKIYNEEMVQVALDHQQSRCRSMQPTSLLTFMTLATNITFQTIGKVGFGYDFKLLESKDAPMSPFLIGMNYCLGQVKTRITRTAYWKHLPLASNYRFDAEMQGMKDTVRQVIEERRKSLDATNMKKDLLGFMLNAAPQMRMATCETSANTLGWCLYLLDKHPKVQDAVLQEIVDLGIKPGVRPEAKQLNRLKYLTQVIKETLRLFPPVNNIDKYCEQDCVLPGGHLIEAGTIIRLHAWSIHRNHRIYRDADKFDPDRFNEQNIKDIPSGAWIPFSSGQRACIGQSLALMELRAVLAIVLCKYKFSTVGNKTIDYDPSAITTRPLDLFMTVAQRTEYPEPRTDTSAELAVGLDASSLDVGKLSAAAIAGGDLPNVTVAFGSNMGASEDYAVQMTEQLQKMGFPQVTLTTLDDWDVAAAAPLRTDVLDGVDYLVFGTGNSMWRTFQNFGDSNEDLEEDYMQWSLRTCAMLAAKYRSSSEGYAEAVAVPKSLPFNITLVDSTAAAPFRIASENATIKANQELQDSSGIQYQTGDHLNVYPVNKPGVVREVSAVLDVDLASVVELEQTSDSSRFSRSAAAAMQRAPCSVSDALQYVCDWKEAPSRELVVALGEVAGDDPAYDVLRKAADDVNTLGKQSPGWSGFISQTRTVPFGSILHFVSAMTPRRYSIASCQPVVGNEVHLSVAIVDDIVNGRSYSGLATEYLALLEPGSRVSVSHRPAQADFHLPSPPGVPVLFVGAGTGVAPFRGFLQEMKQAGTGDATLYFGCRSPEYDYLYKDELEQYMQSGTLAKLQPAFSRVGSERKYVQHHISADGAKIWDLLDSQKAHVYVCGSASKLAKDVVNTMLDIFQTHGHLSSDDASKYLADLVAAGRYVEDVW